MGIFSSQQVIDDFLEGLQQRLDDADRYFKKISTVRVSFILFAAGTCSPLIDNLYVLWLVEFPCATGSGNYLYIQCTPRKVIGKSESWGFSKARVLEGECE